MQAVELALRHDEIDLASLVADRPEDNPALRKKLWLAVAKKVISQSDGIKTWAKLSPPFAFPTLSVTDPNFSGQSNFLSAANF